MYGPGLRIVQWWWLMMMFLIGWVRKMWQRKTTTKWKEKSTNFNRWKMAKKEEKGWFCFFGLWIGMMLGAGKQLHVVATFIISALFVVGGEKPFWGGFVRKLSAPNYCCCWCLPIQQGMWRGSAVAPLLLLLLPLADLPFPSAIGIVASFSAYGIIVVDVWHRKALQLRNVGLRRVLLLRSPLHPNVHLNIRGGLAPGGQQLLFVASELRGCQRALGGFSDEKKKELIKRVEQFNPK